MNNYRKESPPPTPLQAGSHALFLPRANVGFSRRIRVFAVDPHLLTAYSQYWERGTFKGFGFFPQEWESDQGLYEYAVFVIGTMLFENDLILLDAGREELARTVQSFILASPKPESGKGPDRASVFIDNLRSIAKSLDSNNEPEADKLLEYFVQQFQNLVRAGGIPLLRGYLGQNRLRNLLHRSKLYSARYLIGRSLREDQSKAEMGNFTVSFDRLITEVKSDRARYQKARNRLSYAYRVFRETSQISDDVEDGVDHETPLPEGLRFRYGEVEDVDAIFEVHLLNCCLALIAPEIDIAYVSQSIRMYDFCSGFRSGLLRSNLVHPRLFQYFKGEEFFLNHKNSFDQIVSSVLGIVQNVTENNMITEEELEMFERQCKEPMYNIRSAIWFGGDEYQKHDAFLRDGVIGALRSISE
ncbi:MAG: hypothetical protein MJA29_05265, partial [Candidatus Omnitrophica bacterium]|nr:hypothetical protein [Candidatus Omnitrophota bacterium]